MFQQMNKHIYLAILTIIVVVSISVPIVHWVKQSGQRSAIDEIGELVDDIKKDIPPKAKISYTSKEEGMSNLLFYNYALLTMTPIVIAGEHFEKDTVIAIDLVGKVSKDMYPGYSLLRRRRSEDYMVQLLVKK